MLNTQQLAAAVERLVANASRPAKVIIFGSYGRGDADDQSDLDLMVIESELPDKGCRVLAPESGGWAARGWRRFAAAKRARI